MPENENPRSYVRPMALPIPTHKGLKITARNATVYTCEFPTRREVAKENYERRKNQMTRCGYRSVNYKPYQSVGDLHLDERLLILSALGQGGNGPGDVTNQVRLLFDYFKWSLILCRKEKFLLYLELKYCCG